MPAVNQIEVHPYLCNEEVRAADAEHGILTEAWSPLAKGRVLNDPVVGAIAGRTGRTPAQVVLRWHVQRGDIVFPKSTTPARIEENFQIFDFELEPEDIAAISALDRGEEGRTGPNPDVFAYRAALARTLVKRFSAQTMISAELAEHRLPFLEPARHDHDVTVWFSASSPTCTLERENSLYERAQVFNGESLQDRCRHGACRAQQAPDRCAALGGHAEPAYAAVSWVFTTSHHSVLHESIDEARHGRYRNLQLRGQLMTGCLVRIDRDHGQDLELLHCDRSRDQGLRHRGQRTAFKTLLHALETPD